MRRKRHSKSRKNGAERCWETVDAISSVCDGFGDGGVVGGDSRAQEVRKRKEAARRGKATSTYIF